MKKPFEPNFRTPQEALSKEELNKIASNGMRGPLSQELHDNSKTDIIWEAEQIAKSYGIYLEFNRAKTGEEKEWMYLIRVGIPGGGPLNRQQWMLLDELSEKYTKSPEGHTSMRLTTRQNIQFHWVSKQGVLEIVKRLAESDLRTINGCGDNTRNVMACPLSATSKIFNANAWAKKTADYFQLPLDPFIEIFAIDPKFIRKPGESFEYGKQLLNRKFKIAFTSILEENGKLVLDNCVEALTNDAAVVPILENSKVTKFQIYVGGGQGERNGKPSLATLAQPIGIVTEDKLLKTLDAVVAVHREWGDRQNRIYARVKFVIKKMGAAWYRERVEERLKFKLEDPRAEYDYGPRHLHHGWQLQSNNGLWAYGAFIENGRVWDISPNGKLKTMVREIMKKYNITVSITPNQDLLFMNIPADQKQNFESDLQSFGFGSRNGKPYSTLRLHSGACVGRDTCRLTYTDSEQFEPELMDQLEQLGWGHMTESIGITGCERQCFRPSTKTIGLVGAGMDRYQLRLMGDETAKFQGRPIIASGGEVIYLKSIPRERVAPVIDVLFKFHKANAKNGESMGAYHRRIGMDAIIAHLKENAVTADLMAKTMPADYVID